MYKQTKGSYLLPHDGTCLKNKVVYFKNQTEVKHNHANLIPWIMEVIRREHNVQMSKIVYNDMLVCVVA